MYPIREENMQYLRILFAACLIASSIATTTATVPAALAAPPTPPGPSGARPAGVHAAAATLDLVGELAVSAASNIAVRGLYAYVAEESLGIVSLLQPGQPHKVGVYPTTGTHPVYDVAVDDSYAYVVIDGDMQILSLADPRRPRLVSTFQGPPCYWCDPYCDGCDLDYSFETVSVYGSQAYLVGIHWVHGFVDYFDYVGFIVDVSNKSQPQLLSEVSADRLAVAGRYLYAHSSSGCEVYDTLPDPALPEPLGACNVDFGPAAVRGDYAYMAGASGLQVLDLTTPVSPTVRGTYPTANLRDVAVYGRYAYLIRYAYMISDTDVEVLDIHDPDHPTLLASRALANAVLCDVAAFGYYPVVATDAGLEVLRFGSDSLAPRYLPQVMKQSK
jgi:hypothetical protein